MARLMIEATLYNGQHLQSGEVAISELDNLSSISTVRTLRSAAMVESVAVIDLDTGEVVSDLASFACLARCPHEQPS